VEGELRTTISSDMMACYLESVGRCCLTEGEEGVCYTLTDEKGKGGCCEEGTGFYMPKRRIK